MHKYAKFVVWLICLFVALLLCGLALTKLDGAFGFAVFGTTFVGSGFGLFHLLEWVEK